MPKISVIVPVYNCEQYLEKCLSSLRNQTMSEIEFLVVDDGSTDHSGGIAQRFASEDPRFVVIHQTNNGLSSARNSGIVRAQGEYLGFVDADDFVDPDFCATLYHIAQQTQAELVCCDYYRTHPNKEYPKALDFCDQTVNLDAQKISESYLTYFYQNIFAWNKLYRADLLRKTNLHFEQRYQEDTLFLCRLLPHLSHVAFCSRSLYHYVQHPRSATNRGDSPLLEYTLQTAQTLRNEFAQHPLFADYVFVHMLTGIIFSGHYRKRPFTFYHAQMRLLAKDCYFSSVFCQRFHAGTLKALTDCHSLSQKFVVLLQPALLLAGQGKTLRASAFIWTICRIISLKQKGGASK